jgi:predicted O-linked N-acetylglucosamine transferase (SPINDLY family)
VGKRPSRNDPCPCGSGQKFKRCCLPASAYAEGDRARTAISALLQAAQAHLAADRFAEASAIYDQILLRETEQPVALANLGVIAYRTGRSELAITLLARAIAADPQNPSSFVNLGNVYESSGALPQAIANYRQAVALDAGLEWAHLRLGDALQQQGNLVEGAVSISRALTIKPDFPEAIKGLGDVLLKAGKLEQAVVCFRKALSLAPGYAEVHNNLGNALDKLHRIEDSIASFQQAIALRPTLAPAHANLGRAFIMQARFPEAAQCCQRAVELQPDFLEAHLNLGNSYRKQGMLSEAVGCYRHLLSLAPHHAVAHNNLAGTYMEQDELTMAYESFEKAIQARPSFPMAYSNLLYFCAFTRYISPAAERTLAEGWEKARLTEVQRATARQRASASSGTFPICPLEGRKLRLGIVSPDLGEHPVSEFLEPFFKQLDRSRFHLTLFPTQFRAEARAVRIHNLADNCIPLMDLTDDQAVALIQSEQIDVLVDASGHTLWDRLGIFARRAAPVQISYVGYWSTTGLTEMDWFFPDPGCDAGYDAHFTEGLWRLPRLTVSYIGDRSLPESSWKPDPDGTIWLGSFNRYCKIRKQTLALWAGVLDALPQAKLLLEDSALHEEETHQRILAVLASHGIAGGRVEFIPYIRGHERHMVLYDRLDIALDTVPFNSGTTAYDALWMGVPLVALEGDWVGGRMGSGILKAFGRPEWIAQDAAQYAGIVAALARDVEGRRAMRRTQRARMAAGPLCDAKAMTTALEDAFVAMYNRWLATALMDFAPLHRESESKSML